MVISKNFYIAPLPATKYNMCKEWFSNTKKERRTSISTTCCVWSRIGKVPFTLKSLLTTRQFKKIFTFNECINLMQIFKKSKLIAIMKSSCNMTVFKLTQPVWQNQLSKHLFWEFLLHPPYSLDFTQNLLEKNANDFTYVCNKGLVKFNCGIAVENL